MKLKLNAVNIKNRRATFDFDIVETYTAGIVLTGTEIKSIRLGKAGLTDAFCYENNGEIWIKNMYVGNISMDPTTIILLGETASCC